MGNEAGPIRVAVMGLGFIGREIATAVLAAPDLTLVGAVDSSPDIAGKKLSDLVAGAPPVGVKPALDAVLRDLKGGVLLHATGSRFRAVKPQLEAAVRAGVHVVSTCEELAYPWLNFEDEADQLDRLAAKNKVCVLGTGVNPGFVLDRLVATAGSVCGPVRRAHAQRVVDLSSRREALRRKAGVGLTVAEFERGLEKGELGHVGLPESAALAALGLGFDVDEVDVEEEVSPVVYDEDLRGPVSIPKGRVAGVYQRARVFADERELVDLELTLAAGVDEAFDRIEIDADPKVSLQISGGYAGERATAWAAVNSVARVAGADPGILTVLDLPAGR